MVYKYDIVTKEETVKFREERKFELFSNGFITPIVSKDYTDEEREYYVIEVPVNILKNMTKIKYDAFEEDKEVEFVYVSREDKTKYIDNTFILEDLKHCYVNMTSDISGLEDNEVFKIKFVRMDSWENVIDDKIVFKKDFNK